MRAIGVIRTAVSADPRVDERLVRGLAGVRGYDLSIVLVIHPGTYMPTVLTVQTVVEHHADAVLAPSMAHLGSTARAVALVCDVITPHETVRRAAPK